MIEKNDEKTGNEVMEEEDLRIHFNFRDVETFKNVTIFPDLVRQIEAEHEGTNTVAVDNLHTESVNEDKEDINDDDKIHENHLVQDREFETKGCDMGNENLDVDSAIDSTMKKAESKNSPDARTVDRSLKN